MTKKIKEGANVPVYVLAFLLGQYCSSDDDAVIDKITEYRLGKNLNQSDTIAVHKMVGGKGIRAGLYLSKSD